MLHSRQESDGGREPKGETPSRATLSPGSPAGQMTRNLKFPDTIGGIDKAINTKLRELGEACGDGVECFPFLLADEEIRAPTVDKVFDDLQDRFGSSPAGGNLVVVVDSGGGDIDAAYNLALLFRRYGSESLTFIVPRWSKSAATLLVCAGDRIKMTPVAELGPLDPQITELNPLEQRLERFSPLHVESTLELIRNEYTKGNKALADGLMQRLQFPITLGSFKKSLDVGKQYAGKLLASRMLKDAPEKAQEIAVYLTEGYADHGYCINLDEATALGLIVEPLSPEELEIAWAIHKLARKKGALQEAKRKKEMEKKLKELPAELLDTLPPGITNGKEGSDVTAIHRG